MKGDWVNLVDDDLDCLSFNLKENEIQKMNKNKFKKYVKSKMSNAVFKYLLAEKEDLSKRFLIKSSEYKII